MLISDRIPVQVFFSKDKLFCHPFFWLPVLISTYVALFADEDVLSGHSYLSLFVTLMGSAVPSIDQWGAYSNFPGTTRLYFAVMWLFVPLQLLLLFNSNYMRYELVSAWKEKRGKKYYAPMLALIFLGPFAILAFSTGFDLGDDCLRFCITETRGALAMVGFLIPLGAAMSIAAILCPIIYFRPLYRE